MKADAISIVESAYDGELDTRTWFRRLLEHAAPKLDRGFGVAMSAYDPNLPPGPPLFEAHQMDDRLRDAQIGMFMTYPDVSGRMRSSSGRLELSTEAMGLSREEARGWPPHVQFLHSFGVRDLIGIVARDPSGHAIFLWAPIPEVRPPTERERSAWCRITTHISAGARLRRALEKRSGDDLAEGADAVLSPSGSITHAEVAAQSTTARESLRRAAKAIDRARSKARTNEDEALELWQGLIAGRWSLVDHFDTDGRRFLLARKNDPDVTDPRALTLRERQVLAYAAMGHSLKLIAYSLGVSVSSVSTSRKAAMRKLGLRTHADVVQLFAPAPHSEEHQDR